MKNEQTIGARQLREAIQSQEESLVQFLVANNRSDLNSQLPTGRNPVHLVVQMRERLARC